MSKLGETVENRGAEEPGLLWSMGSQIAGHDLVTGQQQTKIYKELIQLNSKKQSKNNPIKSGQRI